ncbi:winged helix DNA-binding domain-containing protein [Chitinophaga barathri]|uniref:Winged helix DNA-binding domain-containing protein n=1 Tax=Chitinophaga barathri TaxID=1647451 RepID=A0A3N4M9E9_9BACT|nr:winged helix DNA-binding domain-containing protein [Chitinophaga barathri]RPD38246.1 winged helix DNA-binding domain-containing protein [Chitinophaga barathri]
MKPADLVQLRLHNQQITEPACKSPEEVVQAMIAVQAQDYAPSKFSLRLRLPGLTEAAADKAFNEGKILRTHLMRPTWHFAGPADIRWLLALTAPRVHQANAYYYRQLGLDKTVFSISCKVIEKTLAGNHLTRAELNEAFKKAKVDAKELRLAYLLMYAELEGIICSGPRIGKQFTYALLEERVPPVRKMSTEEALAQFLHRFFITRGPATIQDFVYWSGLTIKEARAGLDGLPSSIEKEGDYYFVPATPKAATLRQTTFIMPDYEEYGMSYKDKSFLNNHPGPRKYLHNFVVDGRIRGTWLKDEKGKIQTDFPIPLDKKEEKAVKAAIDDYLDFFEK